MRIYGIKGRQNERGGWSEKFKSGGKTNEWILSLLYHQRNIEMLRVNSPPDLDPKSACPPPPLNRVGFEGVTSLLQIIEICWRRDGTVT
jgi:hypothetical protein